MPPRSRCISLIASLGGCLAWSQVSVGPEPGIEPYFKALLSGQARRADESGARLQAAVKVARPEEITATLPLIFAAMSSEDWSVSIEGSSGLDAVSKRPDGAALLTPSLPKIYEMLATNKSNQFAVVVLDHLRPAPPEAVRIVAEYMGRCAPNDPVQQWATQFVIGNAHGDDRLLDAITNLASQRLDQGLRYRLLDLITYYFKGNERLLGVMGASLTDPDPVIRARAAYNLGRIDREYLERYKLDLQRMAADSSEPKQVKDAADLALRVLAGSAIPPEQ